MTLAGLDAGAATRLAANVIGADELPAAVAGRVLATSEGNPLFVGELVRMLVQDGALKREGDRWTAGGRAREARDAADDPGAARRPHRAAASRGAHACSSAPRWSAGSSRARPSRTLPREVHADLDARLESLRRSELIEPDTGWFLGEPALRFHHVLIRDAAYRRCSKDTRAELHERFADWLVARVGDAIEHDETIGWHLEQAHQHLRELGPLDDARPRLGERAARHLGAAGPPRARARRPAARGEPARPRLDRLDAADPARADLALDWCEALLAAGDVGPAARARSRARPLLRPTRSACAHGTPASRGQLAVLTDPQALRATADAVAAAADDAGGGGRRRGRGEGARRPRDWRSRGSARSAPARPRSTARSPPRAAPAIAAAPTPCSPARRSPRSGDRAR